MDPDRRASRRTQAQLPFRWRPVAEEAGMPALLQHWGLAELLDRQRRLASLDEEFQAQLHGVADASTVTALRALAARIDVVAETCTDPGARPEVEHLELSADGVGFASPQSLPTGARIGLHLVLPGAYHVVCHARVSNCRAAASGYRIGAELLDPSPDASRKLTQFVIR